MSHFLAGPDKLAHFLAGFFGAIILWVVLGPIAILPIFLLPIVWELGRFYLMNIHPDTSDLWATYLGSLIGLPLYLAGQILL